MAGRFPGAPDVDSLWAQVRVGVEGIRTLHARRSLQPQACRPVSLRDPRYVPVRGVLDGVDQFDARLFGYAPREAALLDPQQRLLLECAWTALETAGMHGPQPQARRTRIGV